MDKKNMGRDYRHAISYTGKVFDNFDKKSSKTRHLTDQNFIIVLLIISVSAEPQ